jgi:hypothetical protein
MPFGWAVQIRSLCALTRSAASGPGFPGQAAECYLMATTRLSRYGQVAAAVKRGELMAEASMRRHTAIVTGSNHGIGAATALALGRRGYAVLDWPP